MKTLIATCALTALVWSSACTDRDILESKPGVSLPPVSNLALEKAGGGSTTLTWDIPAALPDAIRQPVSVFIQVNEIVAPHRAIPVFNTTLPDAPTEFVYSVPDAGKTYHLTVKLYGNTESQDKNYSSEIYSPGQTVVYSP